MYYMAMYIAVSFFVMSGLQAPVMKALGAVLFVVFILSVIQLVTGYSGLLDGIGRWCVRCCVIAVAVLCIFSIGADNMLSLF